MDNIFTEPKAADTAGAIGYAAAKLQRIGRGDCVMFVQTADHHIETESGAFEAAYMAAARVAKNNPVIGTLGIDMRRIGASSEYGCIEMGAETFVPGAYLVNQFKEKPDMETARKMLEGGIAKYNSGMYFGRPEVFLKEFNRLAPEYGAGFFRIARQDASPEDEEAIFEEMAKWKKAKRTPGGRPAGPIDKVLSELLKGLFVVSGDFIWKDIGGYKAIRSFYRSDYDGKETIYHENGNIVVGEGYTGAYDGARNMRGSTNNVVVGANPSNITLNNCSGCLVINRDAETEIEVSNARDVLVVYNPNTRTVIVAPVNVDGELIKKVIAEINKKAALAGYVTGDMSRVVPADKRVRVLNKDQRGNRIYEARSGDGIILFSERCKIDVSSGLAEMVSMQGKHGNMALTVRPQARDKENIEIILEPVADSSELTEGLLPDESYLTKEDRVANTIRMIRRGDKEESDFTPEYYAKLYSISEKAAQEEVSLINRKFVRYRLLKGRIKMPKYGTSGLRGKAEEALIDLVVFAAVKGVNEYLIALGEGRIRPEDFPQEAIDRGLVDLILEGGMERGGYVGVAGDFRPSTSR
ncbi:MAG: hypothetical protein KAS86_01125, partial [Candidatus Omnitrophica bacterium]|nr:hypothetical protein [Candidatus Omnitrophota bacterium]